MGSLWSRSSATPHADATPPGASPGQLSYLGAARELYDIAVTTIIRPPRAEYRMSDLGPALFTVNNIRIERVDFHVANPRGLRVECSWWRPAHHERGERLPVLVYLHGNSSCRVAALECLDTVLRAGWTMATLDFSGSGMSAGEFISLGYFERDDAAALIAHLRATGRVSAVALWGRSMGAATALMHVHRDPTIAAVVLDSPFADLRELCHELVTVGATHAGFRCVQFNIMVSLL